MDGYDVILYTILLYPTWVAVVFFIKYVLCRKSCYFSYSKIEIAEIDGARYLVNRHFSGISIKKTKISDVVAFKLMPSVTQYDISVLYIYMSRKILN